MNWTEGALSRHSRGKGWDKDAARQKQYFAKARARKNAPSSGKGLNVTSFVPDYIPQPLPSQQRQSAGLTSTRKQRTPRRRLIHKQTEGVHTPSYSPSEDVEIKLRKRKAEDEQPLTTTLDHARQELDIAEKRRRLLEKADWTGVITQKPALVDFSWQNNRSTKPLTKSMSKHDLRSGLPSRGSDQKGQPSKKTLGRLSGYEMKINIGNQNLQWSRGSNSVRSLSTRHDLVRHLPNHDTSQAPMSPYQQQYQSVDKSRRPVTSLNYAYESPDNVQPQGPLLTFPANTDIPLLSRANHQENRPRESDEPKLVVQTHAPVIHQPQPKRGARSRMFDIRSPDLREDSSTVGVLGASVQTSSRLTSEDIRWNSWLSSNNKPTSQQMQQQEQPSISISPGISQYWNTSEESSSIKSPAHHKTTVHTPLYSTEELQQSSCMSCSSGVHVLDDHQSELLSSEPELPQLYATISPSISKNESKYALQKGPLDIESESSIEPGSDLVIPLKTQLPVIPNAQDLLELLSASEKRQDLVRKEDNDREPTLRAEDEDEI
ncbi:hypothetical protein FHETE_8093 [Fusarium heterosporum]|uniref:Uncharacterized protein n=1 Tax=Fusarium heterosporum TaxID=42747 RepID=A0A8H5T325_FUSHE|nr:hypothetical protein FHETE_8093 [Fusarium heterosporum]